MTIYGYEYHHIRSGPVPSSLLLLGSSFKVSSSWGRSGKTGKDGLWLMCVGNLQVPDVCVNTRSIAWQRRGRSTTTLHPFAASSAETTGSIEVQLAIKWSCRRGYFAAACVFGNLSRLRALQGREAPRRRQKNHMPSIEWSDCFCDAVCAWWHCKGIVLSKGHRHLPRTGQLLERLEAVKQHNQLAEQWGWLSDWWIRDECRQSRKEGCAEPCLLNDGGVWLWRISRVFFSLHSPLMSNTTIRRDTSMVVSLSLVGLAFRFFFLPL